MVLASTASGQLCGQEIGNTSRYGQAASSK